MTKDFCHRFSKWLSPKEQRAVFYALCFCDDFDEALSLSPDEEHWVAYYRRELVKGVWIKGRANYVRLEGEAALKYFSRFKHLEDYIKMFKTVSED